MDSGLNHRVVLITGASGGIGLAAAKAFATEGASLVLQYRTGEERLREKLPLFGSRALLVQADISDESSVVQLFSRAQERFSYIDTVVANAGVWPVSGTPIQSMSLEQWRRTIDVNLTGTFLTCRQFFRHLQSSPREDPSLVLIASTAALFGEEGHVDYAASKAAMAYGMTLTLKNEIARLAPRGRVNTICPGWVDTPMAQASMKVHGAVDRATSTMSLRKIAQADDIARAILFLASPRLSGHMSGAILPLAGGMEGRLLHDPLTARRGDAR